MRPPLCPPTATTAAPSAATRPSNWLRPRVLGAAVKSRPASVAGGKPSALAPGAGLLVVLWAPTTTTTAMPTAIIVRIGRPTQRPAAEVQVRLEFGGDAAPLRLGQEGTEQPGPLAATRRGRLGGGGLARGPWPVTTPPGAGRRAPRRGRA